MRENGLIQGRLEGNVRLELEVIRKTLANSQASKEACVLKEQKGKKKKKNQTTGGFSFNKPRRGRARASDARQLAAVCSVCHKAVDHKRGATHNKHISSTIWKKSFFRVKQ